MLYGKYSPLTCVVLYTLMEILIAFQSSYAGQKKIENCLACMLTLKILQLHTFQSSHARHKEVENCLSCMLILNRYFKICKCCNDQVIIQISVQFLLPHMN